MRVEWGKPNAAAELAVSGGSLEIRSGDLDRAEDCSGGGSAKRGNQKPVNCDCKAVQCGNRISDDRRVYAEKHKIDRESGVVLYGDSGVNPSGKILVKGFAYACWQVEELLR